MTHRLNEGVAVCSVVGTSDVLTERVIDSLAAIRTSYLLRPERRGRKDASTRTAGVVVAGIWPQFECSYTANVMQRVRAAILILFN